jgi:hypothetical protein
LCPFEGQKAYIGFSQQRNIQTIDSEGYTKTSNPRLTKSIISIAYGRKLHGLSYATITAPYVINHRQDQNKSRQKSDLGDASLGFRWPMILQNFADPHIPQVQFTTGYKFANGRSINQTKDTRQLDVTGSGYQETKLGLDLWWGMFALKGGVAQNFIYAFPQKYHGIKEQPGVMSQTTLTFALEKNTLSSSVGYTLNQSQKRKQNDKSVDNSEVIISNFFTTISYKYTLLDVFVFSYTANGIGKYNQNTIRAHTYNFSFSKAWL